MKQSGTRSKKGRQSVNHKAKRAAATLRRNTRANQRAIKRAKQIEYFKSNPWDGSPSQVERRKKKLGLFWDWSRLLELAMRYQIKSA
jgi:hypothetical protein